jgi:regulator of sigma E protease
MEIIAVLATIILFGLIVMVHEGGHFMAARLTGMGVFEFSIGFGPAIVQWKKNNVLYAIRIIPLGGYVRIAGVSLDDEEGADRPDGFDKKCLAARVFVLVAGVLMNVVLALVVYIMIGCFIGKPVPATPVIVKKMAPEMPAIKSGLQEGDIIESVDGKVASDTQVVSKLIKEGSGSVKLAILRDGAKKEFTIIPEEKSFPSFEDSKKIIKIRLIGIEMNSAHQMIPVGEAIISGFQNTWGTLQLGYYNIVYIFSGRAKFKEIGGPVMVMSESYKASKDIGSKEGLAEYLYKMALFSTLIGMFNLLPIPVVDGGRIVIEIFKSIYRKPVDKHKEAMVHIVGFFILIAIMAAITFKDIFQLSTGKMP